MSTIDHRLHCRAWRLTRREATTDEMDADRRYSPWPVSAIGGAFVPFAAFLPWCAPWFSGSMGRCTGKDASVNDPRASRQGAYATGHWCHGSGDRGSRLFPDGSGQRCRHPARLPADHCGGDERVTASVCPCSSQSSQNATCVTPGGGTLRLLRLIRVLRLIRGTGMHRIRHEAWIRHENVPEAAGVRGAAPCLGLVAPWPRQERCSDPRSRDLGPEKPPAAPADRLITCAS